MSLYVDANLAIGHFEGDQQVGDLSVNTSADGTLSISSSGNVPWVGVSRARRGLRLLKTFVETTGQSVSLSHDGRRLLSISRRPGGRSQSRYGWWAIAATLFRR